MFGRLGGAGWDCQHSWNTTLLNDIIIDLAERTMKEVLCREIDGSIRDNLEEKG